MNVLGISAFYHDSAAALVRDGEIVAAAQEERFSRQKFDAGFPSAAAAYCLETGGVKLEELDSIAFYDKPLLTFDRLLETYFAFAPAGFRSFTAAMPAWLKEKLLLRKQLLQGLNGLGLGSASAEQLRFGYHHHSHAASAFLPSPFDSAAVLVMDGVGEWATTTLGHGHSGGDIELLREIRFPHSLGLLYAAFTYYLGFKVNSGEFKVMGLAPYGEPRYVDRILQHLVDLKDDGSFRLDLSYFNYCTGLTMTNPRFAELFGAPRREPESHLTQQHMDIAASVQAVTEEIVLRLCRTARRETGERNLCLAGGVALNCVASGKVLREGIFERLWIQPAAGDAGGALGVALAVAQAEHGRRPTTNGQRDAMAGAYLGPEFSRAEILPVLQRFGAVYHERVRERLFDEVVDALADEKVVGWFHGRMEFGPRALGNRSILGDARSESMQRLINLKIKYREGFRPFAPAVLRECVDEYFDFDDDSPYMLLVGPVREARRRSLSAEEQRATGLDKLNQIRSDIPAVTHINHSARIQTVHADTNPAFHQLLTRFRQRTGYGVLVNTSFNIRGEPIVCSPEDAYRCFMGTEMDVLALDNFLLYKDEQ
ncbi:MAG: carbamoyltransferase [Acidobacteriota bacterium]